MTSSMNTFDDIYDHLNSRYSFPVLPAASQNPYEKDLSHAIASLSLHPTLEAILHVLNNDLPSAHFLCRHMQNKPAWEGMYIHGILHRIEGDYRNAEAWYGDIEESDCFKTAWPEGLDVAISFIIEVEKLRKQKVGDAKELEKKSEREIGAVVEWCKKKFGTGRLEDATTAWVEPSEENRKIAAKQLVGGEGWRKF